MKRGFLKIYAFMLIAFFVCVIAKLGYDVVNIVRDAVALYSDDATKEADAGENIPFYKQTPALDFRHPYSLTANEAGDTSALSDMDGVTLSSFTYFYYEDGREVWSESYSPWNDDDPDSPFTRQYTAAYEYDGEGQLSTKSTYSQFVESAEPSLWSIDTYEYDEDGGYKKLTEDGFFNYDIDHTVYCTEYDAEGRRIHEYELDADGDMTVEYSFSYDDEGYLTEKREYIKALSGDEKVYYDYYVWSEGHRLAVHNSGSDGECSELELSEYNDNGDKTYAIYYDTSRQQTEGYTDENGHVHLPEIDLTVPREYQNPFDEETRKRMYRGYSAVYDEDGREAESYNDLYNINRYRLKAYGEGGHLEAEYEFYPHNGCGSAWSYHYDEAGHPSVTYCYYIEAEYFETELPDGGRLVAESDLSAPPLIYVTSVSHFDADGNMVMGFSFDKGQALSQYLDGSTLFLGHPDRRGGARRAGRRLWRLGIHGGFGARPLRSS